MKINILRKIPWVGKSYFHPFYVDDKILRMEACLPAGQSVPPHYHEHFEEHWMVKQGNPVFIANKERFPRKPGETFSAPKNIIHSIVNEGPEDVIVETSFLPCADVPKMFAIVAGLQDEAEKMWMLKYLYVEKRAGLIPFSNLTGPMSVLVKYAILPIIMVVGKVAGWDKFTSRYF
jgi:quercetin dioxygenase-like cupin family protein